MKCNVSSLKPLTGLFFSIVIFLLSAVNSSAQQIYQTGKSTNASITFRGSTNEKLLFNLSVVNAADSKIGVMILDENGERIFKGTFRGTKIEKLFKLPEDMYSFTFVISNFTEKSVQQFKINTQRRYVEDVTITKNF